MLSKCNPLRRPRASSARNCGYSSLIAREEPSAEIVRVECANVRRNANFVNVGIEPSADIAHFECEKNANFALRAGTLCGDHCV